MGMEVQRLSADGNSGSGDSMWNEPRNGPGQGSCGKWDQGCTRQCSLGGDGGSEEQGLRAVANSQIWEWDGDTQPLSSASRSVIQAIQERRSLYSLLKVCLILLWKYMPTTQLHICKSYFTPKKCTKTPTSINYRFLCKCCLFSKKVFFSSPCHLFHNMLSN